MPSKLFRRLPHFLAILVAASGPSLSAQVAVEAQVGLTDKGRQDVEARYFMPGLTLALGARGGEGKASLSLGPMPNGLEFIAGRLRARAPLSILLDPMVLALPAFDAGDAISDLALRSSLSGFSLSVGPLGCFALRKNGVAEDEVATPEFVAAGLRLSMPAGNTILGLSSAVGRYSEPQASGWYEGSVAGSWPRTVAGLYLVAPHGMPRIVMAAVASSGIDSGEGVAFRLDSSWSSNGKVLQSSIAARSQGFRGLAGEPAALARAFVDASVSGLAAFRVGARLAADAERSDGDAGIDLTRAFRLKLDGADEARRTIAWRIETTWSRGRDGAELGAEIGLDSLSLPVSLDASCGLQWGDRPAAGLDSVGAFLVPEAAPDLGKAEARVEIPGLSLVRTLSLSLSGRFTLERKNPFAPGNGLSVDTSADLSARASLGKNLSLSLDFNLEGSEAADVGTSLHGGRASFEGRLEARFPLYSAGN